MAVISSPRRGMRWHISGLGHSPCLAIPKEVMRRIDWAHSLGERDRGAVAGSNLGSLLRSATWMAGMRAGSRHDALRWFLASPEFRRR
jgi:hypothetical protein